jgi:hypothetical protein
MRSVQISQVIKRTLELSTGSYTQWRNLMELTVEEYGALDHLTDDMPANLCNDCRSVDLIIKRWIYKSISSELTSMIMDPTHMARQLYNALTAIFLNNKRTRAVHLTSDLHEQRQDTPTIMQYCTRIKTIADALRYVNQSTMDATLVTMLTRGLTERHHVTAKILNSSISTVTFDDTCNMLLLDEMQARASERLASHSVLIALGHNNGGGNSGGGNSGGGGGAAPGGNGAPSYGYPCLPPHAPYDSGTHDANFGVQSPSPNQGKTKRKRITNNGVYTANHLKNRTGEQTGEVTGSLVQPVALLVQ